MRRQGQLEPTEQDRLVRTKQTPGGGTGTMATLCDAGGMQGAGPLSQRGSRRLRGAGGGQRWELVA